MPLIFNGLQRTLIVDHADFVAVLIAALGDRLCIFAEAAGDNANVRIDMSSPFAFTVICTLVAFITVPSNLAIPFGRGFGLTVFTTIGTAVSITGITSAGVCADAVEHDNPASTSAGKPNHTILQTSFMGTF